MSGIVQDVPHLFLFGLQVKKVMAGRVHLDGHAFYYVNPKSGKLVHLIRVIGQKPQGPGAQVL